MSSIIRLDDQGNSEEWFFSVLSNNDIWRELKKWMFPNKRSSNYYNYISGDIAIHYNYLSLMKETTLDYSNCNGKDFKKVIEVGDIELVKILYIAKVGCQSNLIPIAARFGHLDIIIFFRTTYNLSWTRDTIAYAAENGHLDVIKYLHKEERNLEKKLGCTVLAIDNAAKNGYIEVVKFLVENRQDGWTTNAIDDAAENGYLDIIVYLSNTKLGNKIGWTKLALNGSAKNGHLDIFTFLYFNRREECKQEVINIAVMNGHIQIVKFLHQYNPKLRCDQKSMNVASVKGHIDVIRFLCYNLRMNYTQQTLDLARGEGHTKIVDILLQNYSLLK